MEDSNQLQNEETMPVEIPLTLQAIRLLKAYATLSGKPMGEVSAEMSATVSAFFEEKLKGLIADSIGVVQAPEPTYQPRQPRLRPQPQFDEDVAYLGDQDLEDPEEIPPSEPEYRSGGLTDKDLDDDMKVEDPLHEAKGEPLAVDPSIAAEDIMANAIGAGEGYIDDRILKRKKRFGQGRGKVKPLSESTLAEGAGV